jgi:hypothetical protein
MSTLGQMDNIEKLNCLHRARLSSLFNHLRLASASAGAKHEEGPRESMKWARSDRLIYALQPQASASWPQCARSTLAHKAAWYLLLSVQGPMNIISFVVWRPRRPLSKHLEKASRSARRQSPWNANSHHNQDLDPSELSLCMTSDMLGA